MNPSTLRWKAAIAAAVFTAVLLSLPADTAREASVHFPIKKDKIAVVPLYGPIFDPAPMVRLLHRYRTEVSGLRAVVIALDTPGGDVASCQEINEAISDLREDGIYVVAAMGSVAASGGYYVSAACDKVVANAGTLTGSIGVLMETFNAQKVLDKIGLQFDTVKSGEFKDSGNFTRPLSARERALFQGVIDDVYEQFVDVVVEGRKAAMTGIVAKKLGKAEAKVKDGDLRAYVRSFADGRVFSGRKAADYGLVDELGGLDRAISAAAELSGAVDPAIVTYRERRSFAELITGLSKSEIKGWFQKSVSASRRFGFYAW